MECTGLYQDDKGVIAFTRQAVYMGEDLQILRRFEVSGHYITKDRNRTPVIYLVRGGEITMPKSEPIITFEKIKLPKTDPVQYEKRTLQQVPLNGRFTIEQGPIRRVYALMKIIK
jgi:hypothetical protein